MTESTEERGLSRAAQEVFEAWFQRDQGSSAAVPEVETLVAYLCGELPTEQVERIQESLTRSRAGRARLLEVQRALREARASVFSDLAYCAADGGLAAEVAAAWERRVIAALESGTAMRPWLAAGWESLRAAVQQHATGARVAWANLRRTAEEMVLAGSVREPALARSAESAAVRHPWPGGVSLQLDLAEITQAGDLLVQASLDGEPTARERCEGCRLRLLLAFSGERWVLGSALISGGRVTWHLPEFGSSLGLTAGPLDSDWFELAAAEGEIHGARRFIWAPVECPRIPGRPAVVRVQLLGAERWSEAGCSIALRLEPDVLPTLEGLWLHAEVVLGPNATQLVGHTRLPEWPGAEFELHVACPRDAGPLPILALLRLSFRPGPGPTPE